MWIWNSSPGSSRKSLSNQAGYLIAAAPLTAQSARAGKMRCTSELMCETSSGSSPRGQRREGGTDLAADKPWVHARFLSHGSIEVDRTYLGPHGRAPRHLPFRRAVLSFMRWQLRRGLLDSPAAERPGSSWWRAVNERLLRGQCEAWPAAGDSVVNRPLRRSHCGRRSLHGPRPRPGTTPTTRASWPPTGTRKFAGVRVKPHTHVGVMTGKYPSNT